MIVPPKQKTVYVSFTEWEDRTQEYDIHQEEEEDTLEIRNDRSIKIPAKFLDELDWKVKTKLMVVDVDKSLQQLTIGKTLKGSDAVIAMHEIAKGFP